MTCQNQPHGSAGVGSVPWEWAVSPRGAQGPLGVPIAARVGTVGARWCPAVHSPLCPAVLGGSGAQQLRVVPIHPEQPRLPAGRGLPRLPRWGLLRLPAPAAAPGCHPLCKDGKRPCWGCSAVGPPLTPLCAPPDPTGSLAPVPVHHPRCDSREVVSGPAGEGTVPRVTCGCPVTPSPLCLLFCPSSFCPNLSAISTNLKLSHNVAVSLANHRGPQPGGMLGQGRGGGRDRVTLCPLGTVPGETSSEHELEVTAGQVVMCTGQENTAAMSPRGGGIRPFP